MIVRQLVSCPGQCPMSGERRRRVVVLLAAGLLALVMALAAWGSGREPAGATAQRGGTLRLLGTGDIFNLDTTSGYYTVLNSVARVHAPARLVPYANELPRGDQLVPDIATAVPDGERRHQRRRQDLHLPPEDGVKWSTTPPRQVTADRLRARVQDALQPGLADRRARLLHEHDRRHEGVLRRFRQGEGGRRRRSPRTSTRIRCRASSPRTS